MNRELIVERNGRSFVLYAGLLDLAHERGLKAISTTLVQIPSEMNDMMAICHATVETEQGTFTGLGDASPENVSRLMVPHLIRMAETRAKARALRDAVNVGVTALEELAELAEVAEVAELGEFDESDTGEHAPPAGRPAHVRRSLRSLAAADGAAGGGDGAAESATGGTDAEDASGRREATGRGSASPSAAASESAGRAGAPPATSKQLQTIARMARAAGKTISTEGLSRAQASEIISSLIGDMDQRRAS